MRNRLLAIYEDVDKRTRATSGEHGWWPCRRGCDSCCKRLAEITAAVAERSHDADATDTTVVWGNQQSVDYALARLGGDAAPLPLTAWAASSSWSASDELPAPPADPSSPSSAI